MGSLKNITLTFTIILAIFLLPNLASAHNGGRDELGGHFRRADCTYLLHDPTKIVKSAKNMTELISLINQYNSNSDCTDGLSESKVDLEGYAFPTERSTSPNSGQTATTAPTTAPSNGKLQLGRTYNAKLVECTDGDTAVFNVNGKDYKTRFLYIDSPESTTSKEPFGPEAAQYTCSFLEQGKITLETDGRNLFDKYDRLLAWVWVGDKLHQEEITKAGFVEDFYDYGNYKYENRIWAAMDYAKTNHTGIYSSTKSRKEENQHNQPDDNSQSNQEQTEKDDIKVDKESEEKLEEKQEEYSDEKASEGKPGQTSEESKSESKGLKGWSFLAVLLIALLFFFISKRL